MLTAKVEIADERFFKQVTACIRPALCVKCGLCGSLKVDARELAWALHSLIDYSDKGDEELNDFASEFLSEIIEYASFPEGSLSNEEWEKWEAANEHQAYDFLDDYDEVMCGKYEDLVIFHDRACDCFSKDKIKEAIIIA